MGFPAKDTKLLYRGIQPLVLSSWLLRVQ